jgi:hypothetical protein
MSIDFPAEERAIIERWREIDAFKRQVGLFPNGLLLLHSGQWNLTLAASLVG